MDTVHEVLERAWNAHAAGEFEAALRDYIWLFDASANHEESAALRLSYILSSWARLAADHLPARHALVALRDRLSGQVLAAPDDAALFNDIRVIDAKLGDLQHTTQLFRRLPEALAQQVAHIALPALVACGDYALAQRYMPQPEQHLAAAAARLNELKNQIDVLTQQGMADLLANVFNYVTEVALVLDLLTGCGDTAAVARARRQAVELVQAPEARACVQAELDHPGTTLDAMVELQNSVTA
jgi:hypothetical protein